LADVRNARLPAVNPNVAFLARSQGPLATPLQTFSRSVLPRLTSAIRWGAAWTSANPSEREAPCMTARAAELRAILDNAGRARRLDRIGPIPQPVPVPWQIDTWEAMVA